MALPSFCKPPSRAQDARDKARARLRAWLDVRKRVLERDGYRCRVCQSGDKVDVHHVRFRSVGGKNETGNLAALCRVCHADVHGYRLVIQGDANGTLRIERL